VTASGGRTDREGSGGDWPLRGGLRSWIRRRRQCASPIYCDFHLGTLWALI